MLQGGVYFALSHVEVIRNFLCFNEIMVPIAPKLIWAMVYKLCSWGFQHSSIVLFQALPTLYIANLGYNFRKSWGGGGGVHSPPPRSYAYGTACD